MFIAAIRAYLESEPIGFFVVLCGILAVIYALSETRIFARVFEILPTIFWMYFVPMVLATLGFLPAKSPVYDLLTAWFLPASLMLLFLSASLPDIARLGRRTVFVMVIATASLVLGSMVGVLALLPFFKAGLLPAEHLGSLWKGVAALSGSWIGGSANMAAIWQSLTAESPTAVEGQVFAAMIAVDVCVGYSWMALLIALAGRQQAINRWLRADSRRIEEVSQRMETVRQAQARPFATSKLLYMIALGFAIALVCRWCGAQAQTAFEAHVQSPLWRSVLGAYGIMIILVTVVGLGLSLTPVAKLEGYGASKVGYAMLFLVLARIGAGGNLNAIRESPAYLVLGAVWILTHGVVLLAVVKVLRVPLFFAATASQANIGGAVSAPVVAAAYQPGLAVVGLLMAVVGNVLGTFAGLLVVAPAAHFLTRLAE